eukprot:74371_1
MTTSSIYHEKQQASSFLTHSKEMISRIYTCQLLFYLLILFPNVSLSIAATPDLIWKPVSINDIAGTFKSLSDVTYSQDIDNNNYLRIDYQRSDGSCNSHYLITVFKDKIESYQEANSPWSKIRYTQHFYGRACCWKIFGRAIHHFSWNSNTGTYGLHEFSPSYGDMLLINTIKTQSGCIYSGQTIDCDVTGCNFWRFSSGDRGEARVEMRRNFDDTNVNFAGIGSDTACCGSTSSIFTIRNIELGYYISTSPTSTPSGFPSKHPTYYPSKDPTIHPSKNPTYYPSKNPTNFPTDKPTDYPTTDPTNIPTVNPTISPTFAPTFMPTNAPSSHPTTAPSITPTYSPSMTPSNHPSVSPSLAPTFVPSAFPTLTPSKAPSLFPTTTPTLVPSIAPTSTPSNFPSNNPTITPSIAPSHTPSAAPTRFPTDTPSIAPSASPTACVDFDILLQSNDGNDSVAHINTDLVSLSTNKWDLLVNASIDIHENIGWRQTIVCEGTDDFCIVNCSSCPYSNIIASNSKLSHILIQCNGDYSCFSSSINVFNVNVDNIEIQCKGIESCAFMEIIFNDLDAGEISINCVLSNSCVSMITRTTKTDISQFTVLCNYENSCKELKYIGNDTDVKNTTFICSHGYSCNSTTININTDYDGVFYTHCIESWACNKLNIELMSTDNTNNVGYITEMICYRGYACDNLHLKASDSVRINIIMYQFSNNINIFYNFPEQMKIQCGNRKDVRFIRYNTIDIKTEEEVIELGRNEYISHRLPCEGIHVDCTTDKHFPKSCDIEYQLNPLNMSKLISTRDHIPCYWLELSSVFNTICRGTCNNDITFYIYNQSMELHIYIDATNH